MVELLDPVAWVLDDTGFRQERGRLAGCGPAVLGHFGEGRQLPDRCVGACTRSRCCGSGMLDCRLYPAGQSWDAAQSARTGVRRTRSTGKGGSNDTSTTCPGGGPIGRSGRSMNGSRKASPQLVKAAKAGGITAGRAGGDGGLDRCPQGHWPRSRHEVVYQAKWQLALEMIDELISWGLALPVIVRGRRPERAQGELSSGAGHDRRLRYHARCPARPRSVHTHDAVLGSQPRARNRQTLHYDTDRRQRERPSPCRQAAEQRSGKRALAEGDPRHPRTTRTALDEQPLLHAVRVHPPGRGIQPSAEDDVSMPPRVWLLIEWPPEAGSNPATTGYPTCPPTTSTENPRHHRRRSAGASNTTTANSKPASASTTSKDAPSPAGTTAPPSSPPPNSSSPPCDTPPKSRWADLSLYAILRELEYLVATWHGYCPLCRQPVPI